jgi:hypothetical protein
LIEEEMSVAERGTFIVIFELFTSVSQGSTTARSSRIFLRRLCFNAG